MLWMLFTPSCSQALALDRTNIGVFKESLRIQLTISIPAQRKFELGEQRIVVAAKMPPHCCQGGVRLVLCSTAPILPYPNLTYLILTCLTYPTPSYLILS